LRKLKIIVLALLTFFLILGNIQINSILATKWLTGWEYRKIHIIQYAQGAGYNYQMKIITHYTNGIDNKENVYLNSSCRTDFGDIRFTDNDGNTELNFWMENKVNSEYAIFWVMIKDNLSHHSVTIYVYYGNPNAIYDNTSIKGWKTFPSFFDNFEFGNYTNFRRYTDNPILSSESGKWDEGMLCKPSVIYQEGKYMMYYYGASEDPNIFPRKIGLATSVNGYNFTKESSNPILESSVGQWDSYHVLDPSILYYNGFYWLYYGGTNSAEGGSRIGLAKSTNGVEFIKITNGIDNTSMVLDIGEVGKWDYDMVQTSSVIYKDSKFWLYYWARPDTEAETHLEIGLATSTDGVIFTRITDGINGTSKVLAVGTEGEWDARHVFRCSVFYYDNKFRMYYVGNYNYSSLRKEIGYAESTDGKNWTKGTENPLMQITPLSSWDDNYLPAVSFIFQEGDSSKKGLLYYQGAYDEITDPTNEIGLFIQQIKDNWSGKQSWVDVKFNPVLEVVTSPVYRGTYAFHVTSNKALDSEFTGRNHVALVNFAIHFQVRFAENNKEHYIYFGTEYAEEKMLRFFRAHEDSHLKYYNGTDFINFPTDTIYGANTWYNVEIRLQIENENFEVLWNGVSIGANLWDSNFTESVSEWVMIGTNVDLVPPYNGSIYLDEMFIRKYVYPEPSHGSWGIYDVSGVFTQIVFFVLSVVGLIVTPPLSDILTKNKNDKMQQIFIWVIGWLFFGMLFFVWIYSW